MKQEYSKHVFMRTEFNYDTDAASVISGLSCEDPSLAQQSMKDECDINFIMEKFNATGELPAVPLPPQYGDFSGVFDYQTALNEVMAAEDLFMELPAKLRSRFDNDPQKLVEFLHDPKNFDEGVELGLIEKRVVEPATPLPAGSSPPADPPTE